MAGRQPVNAHFVATRIHGVGMIFKIGKQNFNAGVQAYYYAVVPTGGPDWQLRLQLTLLFPKSS